MRRGIAGLALAVAAVLTAGILVPASAASWVDQEWVTAPVGAVECGTPGMVNSTAWGRMLAGKVGTQALDPVAAIDGITVANNEPAANSTASSAAAVTNLGNDAWTSSLNLATLGAVNLGAGVTLPLGTSAGVYTQYGRATSVGLSVGAAGAITSNASGVASLDSPSSATPRTATVQLSTLLDSTALSAAGVSATQLADAQLRVGTVGVLASYDSCEPLWDLLAAPGSALTREYLVNDLALDLTSSRVTDISTAIRNSLGGLETTIDALDYVTTTIPGALTTALNSALSLPAVSLGSVDSLGVAIDVDLTPVQALVTGTLSDGAVSINLGTGAVTVDLEALFGAAHASSTGLNGQAPNTSVLTAPMITSIGTRVLSLVNTFITTTIANAITTAINNATVTVTIGAHLNVVVTVLGVPTGVSNALVLNTTLSGTVGGFTGVAGYATPTASTTVTVAPGLGGLLTPLVNALLGSVLSTIVSAVLTNARTIGATVVTPLKTLATTAASTTISTLTTTTIPPLVAALTGVFTALNTLVDLVVNGRPDVAGSVGAPVTSPAAGRYFETALFLGVVNGSAASVASLYFANASVGPNALR
jgi:hypothetical protein